jgi:hypothetical protein
LDAEVAEEVGRVDRKDWDMLLCGEDDGLKGYLKYLAVREPKVFLMLICRALPPPSRASVRQKALMQMNLQLHHVVSDMRIIRAFVAGERDPVTVDQGASASKRVHARPCIGVSVHTPSKSEEHRVPCRPFLDSCEGFRAQRLATVNDHAKSDFNPDTKRAHIEIVL